MDYPKSVAGVGLLNGKFTDGDPLSGARASLDPAAWANAVTDELLAIQTAAGIVADETRTNQALAAIQYLVQKAQGNLGGATTVAASSAITAAMAGKALYVTAATPSTQTLPPLASVPVGASFVILNANSGLVTVAASGTDALYFMGNGVNGSKTLGSGDTAVVTSLGTGAWNITGGSAQLAVAAVFGCSIASNGYQKLPGGLILQWVGVTMPSGNNANTTFNWPIQFPNGCLAAAFAPDCIFTSSGYLNLAVTSRSRTGAQLYNNGMSGIVGSSAVTTIIAIGN